MLVCGVDDAGRGSMLGPLVIAGVVLERRGLRRLSDLGVKDSKKLTPKRREALYGEIVRLVDGHAISRVQPRSIDASVRDHRLNRLEAIYMARIVKKLGAHVSYVDSCDVNAARFGKEIAGLSGGKVRSYHRADSRFVAVSAASILAKVARDRAIARLKKSHDLGSGYPSDPATVRFVAEYYGKHGSMPPFVRKSWKPVQRMVSGEHPRYG